jgi:4,5-dihydroxyphthalate decarboxylase
MAGLKQRVETSQGFSRRAFIKTSGLTAAAINTLFVGSSILSRDAHSAKKSTGKLSLNLSGYSFPRFSALANGELEIEGCESKFTAGKIGDMNTDVFEGSQHADVTEIGLSPFMLAYANDNFRDYTLLPVFPLRLFRHKSVFIRTDRDINSPQDLRGKSIATPGYSSTSLTWIRGIFQDEYGISPKDIEWVLSDKDSAAGLSGGASRFESVFPKGLSVRMGSAGKDESDLLEAGEVDALFHAAEPRAYTQGHPLVARLFADSRAVERAYYRKTHIFPIMHAIAIKKSILDQNPWLSKAVFDAYSEAKRRSYQQMVKLGWAADGLPWYGQELESTKSLMGDNFYSYGMSKANRKALQALFRYSYQQGLASRELTIEELFDPSGLTLLET